jgi:diacylglycerol O-acyltransferase
VFLASLAGGYRRFLLDRGEPLDAMVLRAIVPVSRRVPGQPVRPGNLVSAMFVELPVDLADPAARLRAVAARTAEQKARAVADATAAVVRMADHIPAALFARGARAYGRSGQGRVNVVASNVPGPSQPQYLAGRRVLELVPYVPTAQEIRASAAMVSYAGRLTIGITGDAEALPDVDRLIVAVGREFSDLVAELGRPGPR